MSHKWEEGLRQHRAQAAPPLPARELVAVRLTSPVPTDNPLQTKPYFFLYEPTRDEFIEETILRLFGRQIDGSQHTWEKRPCTIKTEGRSQSATA